jgi:hypothetical protein
MGSLANTLFTLLLGWVQAAASSIWSAFTTENGGSFFRWIGRNWIILAVILCVIGLIVDLGIYLFRWRPLRVWKSYFNRLRHKEESLDESEQPESPVNSTPVIPRRVFRHEEENETIPEVKTNPPQTGQEDFSRWETEEPEAVYTAEPVPKKQIITGAGYTVPADSPYRRPTEPIEAAKPDGTKPEEGEANKPEIMTQKKRRRRLVVGELFNDPEEELWQYEKPQQLIDKDKAYHQPVYPRNWKTDEGENE